MAELGEFAKHYDEFKALDVEILGVSSDPVEKARETKAKVKLPFPILSDHKLEAMEAYGLRNPEHPGDPPINIPTLVLIDRTGTIRWVHQSEDYRVRPPATKALSEARKLR